MGKIFNGSLKRLESWYRPMFFCTDKKAYEICGYVLYDPDRQVVIGKLEQGWINDSCTEIPDMNLNRKMDINLSSKKPYMIVDHSRTGIGAGPYWIYVPVGRYAKISDPYKTMQRLPNTGIFVENVSDALIFGQPTKITLSTKTDYYKSFIKREEITDRCGISDYELRKALETIKEKGYTIEELLEEQ